MLESNVQNGQTGESGGLKYLIGAILSLVCVAIFVFFSPEVVDEYNMTELKYVFPVFRFLL